MNTLLRSSLKPRFIYQSQRGFFEEFKYEGITSDQVEVLINSQTKSYRHVQGIAYDSKGQYLLYDSIFSFIGKQPGFMSAFSLAGSYYLTYHFYLLYPLSPYYLYASAFASFGITMFQLTQSMEKASSIARIFLLANGSTLRIVLGNGYILERPVAELHLEKVVEASGQLQVKIGPKNYFLPLKTC
mmetsp:Transcript_359/g.213  ORF Transcript_359/g.213 Transcript_359/m.213 type:complete len:186 (+) Transcript_359:2-559(+)